MLIICMTTVIGAAAIFGGSLLMMKSISKTPKLLAHNEQQEEILSRMEIKCDELEQLYTTLNDRFIADFTGKEGAYINMGAQTIKDEFLAIKKGIACARITKLAYKDSVTDNAVKLAFDMFIEEASAKLDRISKIWSVD